MFDSAAVTTVKIIWSLAWKRTWVNLKAKFMALNVNEEQIYRADCVIWGLWADEQQHVLDNIVS